MPNIPSKLPVSQAPVCDAEIQHTLCLTVLLELPARHWKEAILMKVISAWTAKTA